MRNTAYLVLIAGLLWVAPVIHAETEAANGEIEGEVELAYRNVNVDGSERKYDEDFDGMGSGTYLGNLTADWLNDGDGWLGYARLGLQGLGGEPYESSRFRLGKKDSWEFSLESTKQDYMYNLFELVGNEDGAFWDAERERNAINLGIHATDNVKVVVQYRNNQRTGDSLFMKDISRDIFRLEAPLDIENKSFTIGADAKFGPVNLVFRHALNTYTNDVVQSTEGDLGVDLGNMTALNSYHWVQRDRNESDWTTLMLHAPVADRLDLTLSVVGSFLGDEELESSVALEQLGTDFSGAEFGGSCAIGGAPCSNDATCDAINPGDVCVPDLGISSASQSGDTTLVDFNAAVKIAAPLTAHLNYKTYSRDLSGTLDRDLDGDGTFEDLDGDTVPGSITSLDQEVDTVTVLLDYRPHRKVGLRAGVRSIDRTLERSGFGGPRDTDFESNGDETLVLGVSARPTKWLRLNADYEDGEIEQAFTNVSHFMREQTRVRASIVPKQGMRLNLTFRDWENENISSNFRPVPPTIDYDNTFEGMSWAVDWSHAANESVRYLLRYASQELEGVTGIQFDTAGFGGVAPGTSDFLNENTQLLGRVDYRKGSWRCYVMASSVESDGFNDVFDLTVPLTPSLVNTTLIMQSYDDAEAGVDYLFGGGLRVGASFRNFEYDDVNDLLDYEGQHLTIRAGLTF